MIGASQAFFLVFFILRKKEKQIADTVLSVWMFVIGIHLIGAYLIDAGLSYQYPSVIPFIVPLPMIQGPFLYLYILCVIDRKNRFRGVYWTHFIPYMFFVLFFIFNFSFLAHDEQMAYLKLSEKRELLIFQLLNFGNVYLGPVYVIFSLLTLKKHEKNILNQFSYKEKVDLKWLRHVTIALALVWITVLIANISTFFVPVHFFKILNFLIYFSVTLTVFYLGYKGHKQTGIYTVISEKPAKHIEVDESEVPDQSAYKKSGLKEEEIEKYLKKLILYMEKEKPFLNAELSLREMSEALDISPNYLSQIINGQLNKNFFEFVNEYRVECVKKKMIDPDYSNFSLLGIALDCGFNSKSSFNSVFKKITGLTPSQCLKEL